MMVSVAEEFTELTSAYRTFNIIAPVCEPGDLSEKIASFNKIFPGDVIDQKFYDSFHSLLKDQVKSKVEKNDIFQRAGASANQKIIIFAPPDIILRS
jgi:hypothetical protein